MNNHYFATYTILIILTTNNFFLWNEIEKLKKARSQVALSNLEKERQYRIEKFLEKM